MKNLDLLLGVLKYWKKENLKKTVTHFEKLHLYPWKVTTSCSPDKIGVSSDMIEGNRHFTY